MKRKPIKFSCRSPDTVSVTTEREESTKTWLTIVATAALVVGMFLVQSCSNSAKAGPNGGDVVALNDGKTSAEVLANADSGEVMVHTWDNDLKSARPVEARSMTLGADEKQIQLAPHPLAGDPPGYCSRFYGRTLVCSHKDGVCFDRIEPVHQRYAKAKTGSKIDMWTLAHQPQRIAQGKTLRIITEKTAAIHWSFDGWATANDLVTRDVGFGCWFGDLPSAHLQAGARIVFTFLWQEGWEGKDFQVEIAASNQTPKAA